ncbi:MAG: hypothetical protein HY908_07320 [Myxococcales bacterium]|nr:hypothetical protein [Myxococcales bacterium]
MTIRRITISVPEEVARRIKRAASQRSVSAWVTQVLEESLGRAELERAWEAFYREVAPSRQAVRRADAIFELLTKPKRRKRAA